MSVSTNAMRPQSVSVPPAKLVCDHGTERRVIPLDHVPFTIGRRTDSDLVITDARVSREHAAIQLEAADYVLVDSGTRHGTYVNGRKIDRHKLEPNDRIEFGAGGGPCVIFNGTALDGMDAGQEVAAASRVSIFSKLSPSDIQELGKLVKVKKYGADTAVFFQGEPSDSLYMVLKGTVKVSETSTDGHEKILDILGANEIFGELALLDGHPRSATITTCEPSELATISQQDFRRFVTTRPEVLWKVVVALCERIRKTNADMLELTSREVPCRLLAVLDQLAEKHGKTGPDGSCVIGLKFSIDDFAAMVGCNREIVSRLLHRYQEQGLIALREDKQVVIPDPAAFARAIEYAAQWC